MIRAADPIVSGLSRPESRVTPENVELVSVGNSRGYVARTGATLFGAVNKGEKVSVVEVAIAPVGRRVKVDVGNKTGQFAVRLFEDDFTLSDDISLTLTPIGESGEASEPIIYEITAATPDDGIVQALSRLTFGPNQRLYRRLQEIGYEAFVTEQLLPELIDDSNFQSLQTESLVDPDEPNFWKFGTSVLKSQLAHAVFSDRQLQEVMALFWANHFHASYKDGSKIHHQMHLDRAFYRQNAFGNFEDLLLYSARSPFMSQFLDNDVSAAGALNENYARELLELHTVGPRSSYTDGDVAEVARIFTGWHYAWTNEDNPDVARRHEFRFRAGRHDTGDKYLVFLDTMIAGQEGIEGAREGRELIAILARHPDTQAFVCGKLVQLLVADDQPEHFVQVCIDTWRDTEGSMREVVASIILDPSYIAEVDLQRGKIKTSFEYAASTARFLDLAPAPGEMNELLDVLAKIVRDGGMRPVSAPSPQGEPEVAKSWNATSALQGRGQVAINKFGAENKYGFKTTKFLYQNQLETAEEVASYLLTVGTADRYRRSEYEQLVALLKGPDGVFDPLNQNEAKAVRMAWKAILVLPSFQLQ